MLGMAYGDIGKHKEAIEAYREAVKIDPGDSYSYYNIGISPDC